MNTVLSGSLMGGPPAISFDKHPYYTCPVSTTYQDWLAGTLIRAGSAFGRDACPDQRIPYHLRFALQHDQEIPRHAARNAASLFPLLQRPHAESEIRREFRLAHAERFADLLDVDLVGDMHAVLFDIGRTSGKIEGLLCALDQPLACFTHLRDRFDNRVRDDPVIRESRIDAIVEASTPIGRRIVCNP